MSVFRLRSFPSLGLLLATFSLWIWEALQGSKVQVVLRPAMSTFWEGVWMTSRGWEDQPHLNPNQ